MPKAFLRSSSLTAIFDCSATASIEAVVCRVCLDHRRANPSAMLFLSEIIKLTRTRGEEGSAELWNLVLDHCYF